MVETKIKFLVSLILNFTYIHTGTTHANSSHQNFQNYYIAMYINMNMKVH